MEFTFDDLKNAIEEEVTRAKIDSEDRHNDEQSWSKGELAGLRIEQQYINQVNKNPTTRIGGNKWLNRMMTK